MKHKITILSNSVHLATDHHPIVEEKRRKLVGHSTRAWNGKYNHGTIDIWPQELEDALDLWFRFCSHRNQIRFWWRSTRGLHNRTQELIRTTWKLPPSKAETQEIKILLAPGMMSISADLTTVVSYFWHAHNLQNLITLHGFQPGH